MGKYTIKSILSIMSYHGLLRWIPTRIFLRMKYKLYTGENLNLESPKSFNEKLQWLKIYNTKHFNPRYTDMADKIKVKDIVSSLIGSKYVIPTIGEWETFDDIDFDKLPSSFVLKTNHDSGGVVVVPDKGSLDLKKARERIEKSRRINFYWYGREPQYRDIKPKVFAEKYIADESGYELKDYKFFCFDGEPKLIQVDYGRFIDHKRNIYDINWNFVDVSIKFPNDPSHQIDRPKNLEEMIGIAKKLSQNIPFVRVDLYSIESVILFGELTFFHGSGFERFTPKAFGLKVGSWLRLPND